MEKVTVAYVSRCTSKVHIRGMLLIKSSSVNNVLIKILIMH